MYRTGLISFEAFRRQYCLEEIWPPPLSHITIFIAFLSLNNKSHSTVSTYLSGINFRCKATENEDFSKNFIVSKMLEGMRRSYKPKDTRLPITSDLLVKIIKALPQVCFSNYEAALFSSAFSLAFHGFLRVGEITLSKKWQFHQVITIDCIKFVEEEGREKIHLGIPFSKNDQYGKGASLKIAETKTTICPVVLLRKYLAKRPKTRGPLYCHFGGSPVSRYQFATVLNKALKFMGIDSRFIRTHSFRIGAASSHFDKGTSQEEIKRLGRWKSSSAFKR